MKLSARKPGSRIAPRTAASSLTLSLSRSPLLLLALTAAILAAHAFSGVLTPPSPLPASGTDIYVDGERGMDCLNGLSPTPDLCPPPPAIGSGPFKTVTKALSTIAQNPSIGSGPPYTVRIAARWHEGLGAAFVYGPAGAPNYTGETFPLVVPPRTLLKADAASSERHPVPGQILRAVIQGEMFGPGFIPNADTLQFLAGESDQFTSEGGLDGTEIAGWGLEVRGGLRSAYLEADYSHVSRWSQIPVGPPPADPTIPRMSIRIDGVWFSGRSAYDLDAHILEGAIGNFTVTGSRFTTDTSVAVTAGAPVPHSHHTGQALVHVFSESSTDDWATVLQPTFSGLEMTVLPQGSVLPEVVWGLEFEPQVGSDALVSVSNVRITGGADELNPEGISIGIEFASNTGNPLVGGQPTIPRFDLSGSHVSGCAVFGVAVATGASGPATLTRLEISGNTFHGNGVRPSAVYGSSSTHDHFPGAGLHLVRRGGWFTGSVSSNFIDFNKTGIALACAGFVPPFIPPPPQPQDLRISGNDIWDQEFYPAGFVTSSGLFGDGVGVILSDDFTLGPTGTPGTIPSGYIFEGNRVHENFRHGVWILKTQAPSEISPVLRNDRIHNNGLVAAPPPAGSTPGDGVRIEGTVGTGIFRPLLVNETIVLHPFGYGVHNVNGTAEPILWNSIVYLNGGPVVVAMPPAPSGGPDLFGFFFATAGGLAVGDPRTVNFSNFCGPPHVVACGNLSNPGPPDFCISAAPDFDGPTPPSFELRCGGAGNPSPPSPTGCAAPCFTTMTPVGQGGSRSIDRATAAAPSFPQLDAKGAPRVGLISGAVVPDMGALEKQTCIP